MNTYRVWILNSEYDELAKDIYHAKAQACRRYLQEHPNSKYNWSTLLSIARVKKLSNWMGGIL